MRYDINDYQPITIIDNGITYYLHFSDKYGQYKKDIARSSTQKFKSLSNGYLEFYDPKKKRLLRVIMTTDGRLIATYKGGFIFKLINNQLFNEQNKQLIMVNNQKIFKFNK